MHEIRYWDCTNSSEFPLGMAVVSFHLPPLLLHWASSLSFGRKSLQIIGNVTEKEHSPQHRPCCPCDVYYHYHYLQHPQYNRLHHPHY